MVRDVILGLEAKAQMESVENEILLDQIAVIISNNFYCNNVCFAQELNTGYTRRHVNEVKSLISLFIEISHNELITSQKSS